MKKRLFNFILFAEKYARINKWQADPRRKLGEVGDRGWMGERRERKNKKKGIYQL